MKEVRIIAPSRSLKEKYLISSKKLEDLGYKVTYGKNVFKTSLLGCASIKDRVSDLEDAFLDENVELIMCAHGGYNVNQILDYIDYDIIKNNPKLICGFSDITALLNAIYKKTGVITLCGPTFSSLKYDFSYTDEYFKKIIFDKKFDVKPSLTYTDYYSLEEKVFNNPGIKIINKGYASGTIIGGNLCTLNLLQGTCYMPSLKNTILFLEDDGETLENFFYEFDRNFESLSQLPDFKFVKGIVIGRCQDISSMNDEKWEFILKRDKIKNIPVVYGVDFGHVSPMITFPIGGKCILDVSSSVKIRVER